MKNFLLLMLAVSLGMMGNAFGEQTVRSVELKNTSAKLRQIAATLSAQSGVASSVASAVVEAATLAEDAAQVAAVTPKDNNDWTGDHLQIRGNLSGLTKLGTTESNYFAPAFVRFVVTKENGDGSIVVSPKDNFTVPTSSKMIVTPWQGGGPYGWLSANLWGKDRETTLSNTQQAVQPYETYVINKKEVEKVPYAKFGWTYGALLAPFKYQRGYKAFTSSTSAQMYVGYKRDSNGTAEGPFISAGLSTVDVATGVGATTSKQGFAYGLGWVFEIKKGSGFQMLVMAGQDVIGANSGYQYEGDVWYSISLGYSIDGQPAK